MVRQFKPVMRVNNEVMMTINPEPVHLTLKDIVHDLTCMVHDSYFELDEFLMFTKKEIKDQLKEIAQHRSWNFEGRHWPGYSAKGEVYETTSAKVKAKVLKVFPGFETEAQMPEQFQEEYA